MSAPTAPRTEGSAQQSFIEFGPAEPRYLHHRPARQLTPLESHRPMVAPDFVTEIPLQLSLNDAVFLLYEKN